MAQILFKGDFSQVIAAATSTRAEVAKAFSAPIRIEVDATGFNEISNAAIRAANAQARLLRAQNQLAVAQEKTKQSANQLAAAQERTKQTANQLVTQMERTATAEERTKTAQQNLTREIQRTVTEQEKQKTAAAQAERQMQQTTATTQKATRENGNLGDSFLRVYKKMLTWQVMGTVVSKMLGTVREAVDTMKSVDDELVTVRKVTGATADEMDALKERAYETASAYGEAADEYLNSVAAFARAGYGEQAADLAELATKTKLVGDTNAETAQQFLLSVDAAYQYKGNIEALQKVLDGANEIDNKYATSIEKIAEGLGTVAPVASQAHVGIDELTAAIGTITAVTQRSGSEAARAFRALVLNIVGDTKTEIDEGVTWTTGEIAGLRDVIRQYAPDAYEAAKATGEVIDPMKAIGGLAQSMKDGLLTEQQLMNMVSDIGGKLRTSQLLALIQNWDMYQSMLQDYGDAVGSADREIENALDSWTRKTNVLQNEWTALIESFVNTDTIKSGLDVLIGVVDALDTEVGHAAITVSGLALAIEGVAGAAGGLSKLTAFLGISGANPWVLGIVAAGAAVTGLAYAIDKANPSLEEIDEKLQDNSSRLKENEDRLREINDIPWNERTSEILSEKSALEQENAELRTQIDLQNQLRLKTAQKQANQTVEVTTGRKVRSWQLGISYDSMEDAISSIERIYGEGTRLSQWYISSLKEVETTTEASGDALNNYLVKSLENYNREIAESGQLTDDQIAGYEGVKEALNTQAEAYRVLQECGMELTASQQAVLDAQEALTKADGDGEAAAAAYVDELIAEATQAGKTGDAIYELVKQEILLNQQNLDLSQQINALMSLANAAGGAASSIAMIGNVNTRDVERTIQGYLQTGKAKTYEEARQMVLGNIYKSMFTGAGKSASGGSTGSGTGSSSGSSRSSGSGKSGTDTELERLKDIVSLRKSELSLMQERGDSTGDQIAKMRQIQAALHNEAEYLRKIGASQADINALSTEHWKITKQIQQLQEDLWGELEDAVNKKLDEAADARDRQTDAIDRQIQALRDAKEAEDDALKLEELKADVLEKQNALLEAQRERTVRVFNAATGQWEWEADANTVESARDAYEQAKKDLADYERELALQAEIDALEEKKQLIEDTYDALKAEWEEITDSLQEPTREIDDILSDLAANGTPKMRAQIETVNDLLGRLNQYIAGAIGGVGGMTDGLWDLIGGGTAGGMAAGATGGYHFDFTKNPDGGWTADEMNEGFQSSGSSGWKLADGSDADLEYRDTTPYTKGYKGSYTGADMSRDEKWAGQTVEKNGYIITYNEDGYAISAINAHSGSRGESLRGKYQKVDANGNAMYYTGYDKDVDYTLAIKNAKKAGAGEDLIKQLETERQNKIRDLYGGKDPDSGSSGSSGSSKSSSGSSSGKGYDKNIDYSLAIKNAEASGASKETIDRLKEERQNKIDDVYGGKDPAKKYDSGGILGGMGGIKATDRDEIVIPPVLAEKMLEPSANAVFQQRMRELGWLYGGTENPAAGMEAQVNNRTSHDHYGDNYTFGGISLQEAQAGSMTLRQLAKAARTLSIYGT